MSLSIRIICSPDGESISEWTKLFPQSGGEIGRAFGSTMQLSDSSKTVSSTHAIIRKSSRGYQVLDNSTNGLYINGSDKPLGKGTQTALNDGDVLSIGRYRLLVSCFLPAEAKAKALPEKQKSTEYGNDPFSNKEIDEPVIAPTDAEPDGLNFNTSPIGSEVLEEDPFLINGGKAKKETKSFSTSFAEVDDDPLKETTLDFNLNSIEQDRIEPVFNENSASDNASFNDIPITAKSKVNDVTDSQIKHSIAQYKSREDRLNMYTEQALDYAMTKILEEMSPENIESMFTDLVPSSFWSKKIDFWSMYKRYFARQIKNKDWQVKFQAYFQEGIRLQRNLEESN